MVKRMLIDATHPEETRVVVLDGNRLDEFDVEAAGKKPLKGNIYLAKVTRVEPSLQAAFVDYGGNRHGFLPFSEIHPDYYRIPVADREALIAEEARTRNSGNGDSEIAEAAAEQPTKTEKPKSGRRRSKADSDENGNSGRVEEVETESSVDTLEGDEADDAARRRAHFLRKYKIQEVIKRGQVLLIQVTKEERGNKGAALTTYLSLAGRYCVLMPNTPRGGGISRKISNAPDRKRLKTVVNELEIPEGMAVIVRTAGSERTKAEIRRDYEYLIRLWSEIREQTLQSNAPALIHEEGDLIKRSLRDLYSRDTEEILVEGDDAYKAAKNFMKQLAPSHARKIKQYKDERIPLLHRFQVEYQLDAIHTPVVQLKSGGYLVINQTEALVAIDVNSGRSTKERHIEETALKTNLEASDEVARQLRLRDLAGLVVVDYIDMDESRHNREVERRLKEAMKSDRARIQLGRISPFGLLELSRQRLRPSLVETSTEACSHCGGTGRLRSVESTALMMLRMLEEEGIKRGQGEISLAVPTAVALFILNQKRDHLGMIESRYQFRAIIEADDRLTAPDYRLRRDGTQEAQESGQSRRGRSTQDATSEAERDAGPDTQGTSSADTPRDGARDARRDDSDGERQGRRRRGRRGGRGRSEERETETIAAPAPDDISESDNAGQEAHRDGPAHDEESEDRERTRKKRRRGKRGGRRRNKRQDDQDIQMESADAQPVERAPDAGETDDRAAVIEQVASETVTASEPSEAEAQSEDGKETTKPKRPRRSRSRRKAQPTDAAETPVAEAESGQQEVETAASDETNVVEAEPAAESEKAPTEKPKRRSRARKKPQTAAEPVTNGEAPAETSKPVAAEPQPTPEPAPTPAPEPKAAPDEPAFPGVVIDVDKVEDKPRKKGWWSKVGI
ncbi:Rne/Rng family ribonuclease [Limibacillus halophilus]|uniref:Ribonuclease E n=1 Tax=Limibacillus halophilus TaxID=1579333 RepID=A0A839SRZ1_9PROT|nr:ribonuclease E/G [Limibacillus halophilus]MBB3064480.1 ribonuclease E [Limibacillus halophilus]